MRSIVFLASCLVASDELIPLNRRQLPSFGLSGAVVQPASSKTLKPESFPNAVRKQVLYGPLVLRGANSSHSGSGLDKGADGYTKRIAGPCASCMLLKADYSLTDKQGTRLTLVDGVYIHHIIVSDAAPASGTTTLLAATPSCGAPTAKNGGGLGSTGTLVQGFLGGILGGGKGGKGGASKGAVPMRGVGGVLISKGHENEPTMYAVPGAPFKSGFWLGKNDAITANVEAINYKNEPREVYLSIDTEYLQMEEKRPAEYLAVGQGMITSGGCNMAGLALHPPKDRAVNFTSDAWSSLFDGYIVNISPHLHDGAVDLRFLVNDKLVCHSRTVYGADGTVDVNGAKWETISSYTPCNEPIKVSKGDKLGLASEYDLTKHRLRPRSAATEHGMEAEAMAVAFFKFATTANS